MENHIESYGLDVALFKETMTATGAYIAGSMALAAYLEVNGCESFEPGDMDIFVSNSTYTTVNRYGQTVTRFRVSELSTLLRNQGYREEVTRGSPYYGSVNKIENVTTYSKQVDKVRKIQIVSMCESADILETVQHMDMSMCSTWWSPSAIPELDTADSYHTLNRVFYRLQDTQENRVQKYLERGFTEIAFSDRLIYDTGVDARNHLYDFLDRTATDVIRYEEVNIAEFLAESRKNIVVKVAEQWSAYDRDELSKYMGEHQIEFEEDTLYDTPFRQSVIESDVYHIMYADYSVFELVPQRTILVGNEMKTLYEMRRYSTEDWAERLG
jgi:hypothetical protein